MTRATLHRLLDELPENQVERIAELVDAMRNNDPLGIQLALAPEDEADDDELIALEELERDPERGQTRSFDEALSYLKLTQDQLI